MENAIISIIGTVMVSFAIILIFVAGIWFLITKVRAYNQVVTKKFITADEAAQLKEQNTSIIASIKAMKKS